MNGEKYTPPRPNPENTQEKKPSEKDPGGKSNSNSSK